MAHLIDKDALVAEIERIRRIEVTNNDVAYNGALDEIKYFLDTLEVKEVDLEKEIRECLSTYWPEEKELHPFLGYTAKYFFELGMLVSNKAQKGENV